MRRESEKAGSPDGPEGLVEEAFGQKDPNRTDQIARRNCGRRSLSPYAPHKSAQQCTTKSDSKQPVIRSQDSLSGCRYKSCRFRQTPPELRLTRHGEEAIMPRQPKFGWSLSEPATLESAAA